MQAEIVRHALDRVPLSWIIDDSTALVNLNYFFLRQRQEIFGERQRWEDLPVVHPESFTREFAEWCLAAGVRGKFSVVPCPAGIGRVDQSLPLISRSQLGSWLRMCREVIMPAFDITPEMITHTYVVDLDTFAPREATLWEQWGWDRLPVHDQENITRYIETACRILHNVGLTPSGVTSPGGFGNPIEVYARCAEAALRTVTGNACPYFFKRVSRDRIEDHVWHADREAGTAMGEVTACTGDWTGSWTGYGEVDPDRYITPDLAGGRLPEVIDAGDPAVLLSHWQGFYGIHNEDRRGFRAFKTVVERLRERDPRGERTRWRTCGEIARYACARHLADLTVDGCEIRVELPIAVPELTVKLTNVTAITALLADGIPLRRVSRRRDFEAGTFLREGDTILAAFDTSKRRTTLAVAPS